MEEGQEVDLVRLLPDDALADALRRLPRRGLAVSRCVRRAWRDVIDGRRLMLPHLLPRAVGGIFININLNGLDSSAFLARPTATGPAATSGDFDYLPDPHEGSFIRDHCNGLLPVFSLPIGNRRLPPIFTDTATRRQPIPAVNFEKFRPNLKFSKIFEIKKEKIW